jgi:hypothetical protein
MLLALGPEAPNSGLEEAEYETENGAAPLILTDELGRSVPRNHLPSSSESLLAEDPTPRFPSVVDDAAPPVQVAFAALPLTRVFMAAVK